MEIKRHKQINKIKAGIKSFLGLDYSSTKVRELIKEFNMYEMPLGLRINEIEMSPGRFMQFLKNKHKINENDQGE